MAAYSLEVMPTGDRLVFHVRSEALPKKVYTVSLLEHEGRSECICRDWQCRCWPLIRDGEPITNPAIRCKHVRACREHVLNESLPELASRESKPAHSTVHDPYGRGDVRTSTEF